MVPFINDDFVLETKYASTLYHNHAKKMNIIDFHCHLNPKLIAQDYRFDNLGELWLSGDHYKWRAMRAHGIDEQFCTGNATFQEKFMKWAETVPYTMRNPLYHWTHLELKTAFGIDKILDTKSAHEIYEQTTAQLRTPEFSVRGLMKHYNVEVVCTTDDPIDSLEYHLALKNDQFPVKVLPTWRPDKAMAVEDPILYKEYINKLSDVSDIEINSFDSLIVALRKRHNFFNNVGCRSSDHGLDTFYADDYTLSEINSIFKKIYVGKLLTCEEISKFKSAFLYEGALMDYEAGWVQQFHYGALRNNNTRFFKELGYDTGFDSIGDLKVANILSHFLDRLDQSDKLTRTIIYNLNPSDNDMLAAMIGNFQDGSFAGKVQLGAAWWFLDQKNGIENQLNSLSNMGLLSHFVGMLTDSRSFLSYTRHEYFRRILCNLIGNDISKGLLPSSEMSFIGQMVENIAYHNSKNFFKFN